MRKPRVIIIDDEEVVLNGLKMWMSRMGFDVLIFTETGVCPIRKNRSACCSPGEQCADIFMIDYIMPETSGLDLLRSQYQGGCVLEARNKAIISGCTDDWIKKAADSLCCSFFRKPFQLDEISEWLDECVNRIDLSRPLRTL